MQGVAALGHFFHWSLNECLSLGMTDFHEALALLPKE